MGDLKEIKTNKSRQKEQMLTYLKELSDDVEAGNIENLIVIADTEEMFTTEAMGLSCLEVVGMLDTAKLGYQFGLISSVETPDEP